MAIKFPCIFYSSLCLEKVENHSLEHKIIHYDLMRIKSVLNNKPRDILTIDINL